jgi:uncharacterized membrane protein YhaH (DUF805 family)
VRGLAIGVLVDMAAFLRGLLVGVSLGEESEPVAGALAVIIGLAGTLAIAFEVAKRLHDLNRPGTHYRFMLIPRYNF